MRLRQENFISRKSYKSSSQLPLPVYWLRSVMHSRSRFSKYGFTVDERRRMYFNFSQFYLSLSFSFSLRIFMIYFFFFFRYTLFCTISDFFAHLCTSLLRFFAQKCTRERERIQFNPIEKRYDRILQKNLNRMILLTVELRIVAAR